MGPVGCIVIDMPGIETPATHPQTNQVTTMANATASQANQATQAAVLAILAGGRQLRQFEIAAELGLTEHHDWSTHASLEALIKGGLITFERYHNVNRKGGLSKRTYRHFRLTVAGSQAIRTRRPGMKRRHILRDWIQALGF
jgi:predicted ArsR family transcriptional regulator